MKQILMGMIALMLISGSSAFASDKNKPAKKAAVKKECKVKDCKTECKDKAECPKVCKPSCGS
jgi:uncharacterized protein YxeA